MPSIIIGGIKVSLPFVPYPSQIQMMGKVVSF